MKEIRAAIAHICENIRKGDKNGGWTATETRELADAALSLAQTASFIAPSTDLSLADAVRKIHTTCRSFDHCVDCPLCDACDGEYPGEWDITKLEE